MSDLIQGHITHRIRTRLSIAISALIVGVATLLLAGVYWTTLSGLERNATDSVHSELTSLVERWKRDGPDALITEVERRSKAANRTGFSYLVAQSDQIWVAGNIRDWPQGNIREDRPDRASVDVKQADVWVLKRVHLETVQLGKHHLLVARDSSHHDALIATLKTTALAGFGLTVLVAIAAGLAVGRGLVSRVDGMREKIAAILAGAHGERVPIGPNRDEFDRLATQFNVLLDENDRLLLQVREATTNIAHDLRTPLHRMRTRLESALSSPSSNEVSDLLEALSEDTDRLLETFNGLLQIARVEGDEMREAMEPTDVGPLLDDIADLYGPLAEDAGLALRVETEPGLVVLAQRQLIGQALANLVDNAIKYAPRGQQIDVEAHRRGPQIVLAVSDHGPGIPAADRDRVLERLVRLDSARTIPGTGLGLSFVASVARLHGSELKLLDNSPGLRIELPLSPV